MINYSVEKFSDGEVMIYLVSTRYGIIPYLPLRSQAELIDLIEKLNACVEELEIPLMFREAMNGD